MKAYGNTEVRIFVTPIDLRRIADRMEALWSTRQPGDDLTAEVITDKGCQVSFVIDQGLMGKG
jgi:hypothetical protein